METGKITVNDLIDRVLDRGLIIDADLVISVAGIPLVGVCLRAAVAGMETMLAYGVMEDWDRRMRREAAEADKNLVSRPAL